MCTGAAALWPTGAAAQRRSRPVHARTAVVVGSPAYYGYYEPFGWGYGGWYPYGWYAPYSGADAFDDNSGSARIQVTPKDAQVYVDGYLVGTVDDFDGFLQRLDVPSGEHELTIYLEGYQTAQQKVLFRRGATLKISHTMQRLGAGAVSEPPPQPAPAPGSTPPRAGVDPRDLQQAHERGSSSAFGTLAVRIQPRDATVFVDGEEWTGPEAPGPLLIELGEGSHEVEVRKPGLTSYRTMVRVGGGQTVALNVSLSK